jgi:hypothetical protein
MQAPELTFTVMDPPKTGLRVAWILVWCVSAFLLYKAVVEAPPEGWVLWGALGFFAIGCYSVVREFMLRPMRTTTTVFPARREIVVEETAPWRKRRTVTSIPASARFEVFRCDGDSTEGFGVRIRAQDINWLTLAGHVTEERAESVAHDVNSRLSRGWDGDIRG